MKANHNISAASAAALSTVSNGSKILKWKQITTLSTRCKTHTYCFQWFKDTKMKANHNEKMQLWLTARTVSNGSKILKWKQITTYLLTFKLVINCFQWFKDTKMKANHNLRVAALMAFNTVSNGSKILKWKQITTKPKFLINLIILFPMVQRY